MGLIFGGLLTEVGWRWTFLLPGPVALLILLAAFRVIPDSPRDETSGGYDIPGAVSITAGMLVLVYAVVGAPHAGWASVRTIGLFAVAAALLSAFVAIERRSRRPLIRLGILRLAPLRRANLAIFVVFGAYIAFQFVGTLYMQTLLGWSSFETALGFLPAGALVAVLSPNAGKLADRIGTGRMIVLGMSFFVAAYALSLRIGSEPAYLSTVLPTMLLVGLGFSITFPALNIQATAGVADHEQGLASGLLNTAGQVGAALVLAVATAVIDSQARGITAPAGMLSAYRPALGLVVGVAVLGLLVSLPGLRGLRANEAYDDEPDIDTELADELAA
jgi:predicted MFS family arabinose efflux permease